MPDDLYGTDLVLLLLGAPGGPDEAHNQVRGITRLEKLLFLADMEGGVQQSVIDRLRFVPYHYGPYSQEIYNAVEMLEELGLLRETRSVDFETVDDMEEVAIGVTEEEAVERRFVLTEDGVDVANLLGNKHPQLWKALARIKDKYAAMSLRHLIRYVYKRYPEYAEKSVIRDQVL